jgi:hypothetical protein
VSSKWDEAPSGSTPDIPILHVAIASLLEFVEAWAAPGCKCGIGVKSQ